MCCFDIYFPCVIRMRISLCHARSRWQLRCGTLYPLETSYGTPKMVNSSSSLDTICMAYLSSSCGFHNILERRICCWRCKFAQWKLRTKFLFYSRVLRSFCHVFSKSFCNFFTSVSMRQVRPKFKFSHRPGQNRGSKGRKVLLHFLTVMLLLRYCDDDWLNHHSLTWFINRIVWLPLSLVVFVSCLHCRTCFAHSSMGILMALR